MNVALIIAGGSGARTGQSIPKQFLHIHDIPILFHTIKNFEEHPLVGCIVVVCLQGWSDVIASYAKQLEITKFVKVVIGGKTRHESVVRGISTLLEIGIPLKDDDIILIHDANRPMVSKEVIDDCIVKAKEFGACVPVIPVSDWVLWSDDGISSTKSADKTKLMRAQSPEAIIYSKLCEIYKKAEAFDPQIISGISSILIELGEAVYFSQGSEKLFKVTSQEDIELFKAMLDSSKPAWLRT